MNAFQSDTSEGGIFISPSEALNLTSRPPKRLELDPLPVNLIEHFVRRWNNTHQYREEGITTLEDLPEGYDDNFIELDLWHDRWEVGSN